MKKPRFLSALFAFLCAASAYSQDGSVVTGKVIDDESSAPVAQASVYINNSSIGTITNTNGEFSLHVPSLQTADLVCSSVEYSSTILQLNLLQKNEPLVIRLKKKVQQLETVIVRTPEKNGWEQHGAVFLKHFLGVSAFSKKCRLINYKDVKFRYDTKRNILYAWSFEPLIIKNHALGYELQYWLEDFSVNNQMLYIKGTCRFTPMKGNSKKQSIWGKNRATAYNGSLNHFIKTLYDSTTTQQGFVVNLIKKIGPNDISFFIPEDTSAIIYSDTNAIAAYVNNIYQKQPDPEKALQVTTDLQQWSAPGSEQSARALVVKDAAGYNKYFFAKDPSAGKLIVTRFHVPDSASLSKIQWSLNNATLTDESKRRLKAFSSNAGQAQQNINVFYSTPLEPGDFVFTSGDKKYLSFTDYWYVTYLHEQKEYEYLTQNTFHREPPGPQTSTIHLSNSNAINIFPDGNFYEPYDLLIEGYWSFEKLDKLLPLDYVKSKH